MSMEFLFNDDKQLSGLIRQRQFLYAAHRNSFIQGLLILETVPYRPFSTMLNSEINSGKPCPARLTTSV
jgi:hypothetical protein